MNNNPAPVVFHNTTSVMFDSYRQTAGEQIQPIKETSPRWAQVRVGCTLVGGYTSCEMRGRTVRGVSLVRHRVLLRHPLVVNRFTTGYGSQAGSQPAMKQLV